MKEDHLPKDVRGWPTDPYAVLGIAPGLTQRDLKKAYTALIRRYRPEDEPEKFRRIRDAFEMIQQHLKWYNPPPPIDDPPPLEPAPPPAEIARNDTPSEPPPYTSPLEEPVDLPLDGPAANEEPWLVQANQQSFRGGGHQTEVVELWDRACAGEDELAYRRLREIYNAHPDDKEILLRLYWLHALNPDLDHVRHPCDWLVEGLRSAGLGGPCRELYRRYLANHPEEALSARCGSLLEVVAAPILLGQLVEWRWLAAGKLRKWSIIATDLETVGPRLAREDEDTYARLLLFAIDELAWFNEEAARRVLHGCCAEIEKLEHLHGRLGESFARLDFLLELARAWRQVQFEDARWRPILNLIPQTWLLPPHELRPLLFQHLDDWRNRMRETLDLFDEIASRAPILLAQLGRTLDGYYYSFAFHPQPTAEELERRARQFLATVDAALYPQFRWKLLNFCLREFLAPEWLAEVMESRSQDGNLVQLFGQVRNDWPLRVLCQAYRVFWS